MKFIFTKFNVPDDDVSPNYFSQDYDVEDFIVCQRFSRKKFPVYRDELTKTDDPIQLQAGEIQIDMAWFDSGLKSNLGKNAEEFFNIDSMKVIRCLILFNESDPFYLVYFVDCEKLVFDRHPRSKIVSIVLLSAEKELTQWLSANKMGTLQHDIVNGFEYLMGIISTKASCPLIDEVHVSNMTNAIHGFRPKTSRLVHVFEKMNCWDFFGSMSMSVGFMFRVRCDKSVSPNEWSALRLNLFWRYNGLGLNVVKVIDHKEGRVLTKDIGYALYTSKMGRGFHSDKDCYEVFVRSPANSANGMYTLLEYTGDGSNYPDTHPTDSYIYHIGNDGEFEILGQKDNVRLLEPHFMPTHASAFAVWLNPTYYPPTSIQYTGATPVRCLVRSYTWTPAPPSGGYAGYTDEGFDLMMNAVVARNHIYDFLLKQFARTVDLELSTPSGFKPYAYSTLSLLGKNYWIEAMSEYDHFKHRVRAEGTEISARN